MRSFRRSSKGQVLLLSAIIVCILLFAVGGFLADASTKRPPRETEDIYFVFANIKAETEQAGERALRDDSVSYLSDWTDRINAYIEELGYSGSLSYEDWTRTAEEWSVDFVFIMQSTDTILQDSFTASVPPGG